MYTAVPEVHVPGGPGAEIVVEGVEDKEKAEWFCEMECEYIQGFYYAKPMPREAFVAFLREHNK